MTFITHFFHLILYQPLFNALIFLYEKLPVHDFGLAVIILTIMIRLMLYPLTKKILASQKKLNQLQPKIKEIQEKFKDHKEKQFQEIINLYKKEKVNPLAGFWLLLIQTPILIAFYWVIKKGLDPAQMIYLYSFIPQPEVINPLFLNLINLTEPSVGLVLLVGFSQFFQSKLSFSQNRKVFSNETNNQQSTFFSNISNISQKQMLYLMPLFIVFILWKLPAVISLYLVTSSIFSIAQQYFLLLKTKKE